MATDVVIDIGTSKTVILSSGKIVLDEPSVVTVDTDLWKTVYFGNKAKEMVGRTPESLTSVYPIERGVIADYDVAESMIQYFFKKAFGTKIIRPRVIVTLPNGVTTVQHRSLINAVLNAGGRNIMAIESAMAAAMSIGINPKKAHGTMVVDIGAGTTDIATISLGGIAECYTLRMASSDFDEAIMKHIRLKYNMLIGVQTAEYIKKQIGCVIARTTPLTIKAKGKNIFTGLPQIFEVTSEDVFEALKEQAAEICKGVQSVMEKTDPDIVADILSDGIFLTGGGAKIYGIAELLSEAMETKVNLMDDSEYSVAYGAERVLKTPSLLENSDYQYRSMKELIIEE